MYGTIEISGSDPIPNAYLGTDDDGTFVFFEAKPDENEDWPELFSIVRSNVRAHVGPGECTIQIDGFLKKQGIADESLPVEGETYIFTTIRFVLSKGEEQSEGRS